MLTAIVGINWGDEGKGRMVDLLSADYDVICRYQGGNNAGHTVVNDKGKFILNLLPSGILNDNAANIMGCGMVIDLEHLCGEISALRDKGVRVTPDTLKISDRAFVSMPYHKQQDILEEERLADKKYGSTRRGIAPVYGDKYMKKGIRMGDLLEASTLKDKLSKILDWKDITLSGYGQKRLSTELMYQWIMEFGNVLLPFITNTSTYLNNAIQQNKHILFEAQLGALRDIDYGIYPYTTSSQTLAGYASIGAGIPGAKLDSVVGVMKAYSSCVGEGPFTAELFGQEAAALREAGAEYGAATGRPRRVGAFDIPASRYGVQIQGADTIALTKMDVLSYLDKIPVCVAYEIDGIRCEDFPTGERLLRAKPIYEDLEGFKVDLSGCRRPEDLPEEAKKYIYYIEKAIGCPIRYVSVGAKREDYLEMR